MITKHDFKDGDLILVCNYPDNPESIILPFAIRKATRCYYHHCAIYFDGYVYQSIASGVKRTHPIQDYIKGIGETREIAICRLPNFDKVSLIEQIGLKYNYLSTFVFQPYYQLFNTYPKIGNNPKSRNCSQFAAKCYGFDWWVSADPQDLWRESCTNNYVIKETAQKRRSFVNDKLNKK